MSVYHLQCYKTNFTARWRIRMCSNHSNSAHILILKFTNVFIRLYAAIFCTPVVTLYFKQLQCYWHFTMLHGTCSSHFRTVCENNVNLKRDFYHLHKPYAVWPILSSCLGIFKAASMLNKTEAVLE